MNYYDVLNVSKNASNEEIKKSFRQLSMKYHPDNNINNPTNTDKYKNITEAYNTLSDNSRRRHYDMEQNNPFMNNDLSGLFESFFTMQQPPGGFNNSPNIHVFSSDDLFSPFSSHFNLNKPKPIIKKVNIQLEDAFTGIKLPVTIERKITDNNSTTIEEETLYVSIPPGIDNNEIIKLSQKGHVINQQLKGDVKIIITVTNNTVFKRNGLDLIYKQNISLKDALCGFSITLQHLNKTEYKLNNSETIITPNYNKSLPNLGMVRDQVKGKLIIEFNIIFPKSLEPSTIEQLQLLL